MIIGLSVICALVIFSVTAMEGYVGSARSAIYKIKNRESFREGIYKISEDYSDCDCIYIEKGKDNCFNSLLFEFGEYDEFKKISWEEFEQNGIEEKVLAGRNSAGNVVIYAPDEYALEAINGCKLIADGSNYKVYYLSGRE